MKMENNATPYISVIIPTYNEEVRKENMRKHMIAIKEYFQEKGLTYEVIIVLDGPTDNTPKLVKDHARSFPNIKVIDRKKNKGKGYSIREGFRDAKGEILLFTDMDGATPIDMLDRFFPEFKKGADVVIGSRDINKDEIEKHQPRWKELLGDLGNIAIQFLAGLQGVKDTQCGFKAFKRNLILDIEPRTTINRWGLDFELLMLSKRLGYKIKEVQIRWIDSGESLVGISGYIDTLKELFRVRWNLIKGVYDLEKNSELETKNKL